MKNRLRLSLAISHPWSILYYKNIDIGRIPEYIQNYHTLSLYQQHFLSYRLPQSRFLGRSVFPFFLPFF